MAHKNAKRGTRGHQIGAPTRLTPELQEKIVAAIQAGNYVETAAALNGINKKTLYDWLKWGNKAEETGNAAHQIYRDFCNAIHKAIAFAEARDLQVIDRAAQGSKRVLDDNGKEVQPARDPDWKASAWRLERRQPKRWGRKEQVKLFAAEENEEFETESSHSELMDLIEGKDKENAL